MSIEARLMIKTRRTHAFATSMVVSNPIDFVKSRMEIWGFQSHSSVQECTFVRPIESKARKGGTPQLAAHLFLVLQLLLPIYRVGFGVHSSSFCCSCLPIEHWTDTDWALNQLTHCVLCAARADYLNQLPQSLTPRQSSRIADCFPL